MRADGRLRVGSAEADVVVLDVGGFPNLHEANYGQGIVYSALFLKQRAVYWRHIPGRELL